MAGVGKETIDKDIIDAIGRLNTSYKSEREKKPTTELTDLTAEYVFDTIYPKGDEAIDYSDTIGLSPNNDDDNGYILPDTELEGDLTDIFG